MRLVSHVLRTTPLQDTVELCQGLDDAMVVAWKALTLRPNEELPQAELTQVFLPIKLAGMGLIFASDVAAAAFISSLSFIVHRTNKFISSNNRHRQLVISPGSISPAILNYNQLVISKYRIENMA